MGHSATFPLSDLSRHVLSNTPAYRSTVSPSSIGFKVQVCQEVARACRDNGLKLAELGSLSILHRLTEFDLDLSRFIARLQQEVESERPWSSLLPSHFRMVPSSTDEYRQILASGVFQHEELPFRTTALGRELYRMAAYGRASDLSFILLRKSVPLVHVPCNVHLDEGITDCLAPIRIQRAAALNPDKAYHVIGTALDVLTELGFRAGAKSIHLQDQDMGPVETDIARAVRSRSYKIDLCISLAVDLTTDNCSQWVSIRKSFRPLISRSAKIIDVRVFNALVQDDQVLECWDVLRLKTVHSLTNPFVDCLIDLVRGGNGEISAGFSPAGNCIGVVIVLDDAGKSLYTAGHFVSDETGMRHGHFMLYDAIRRSKERNNNRFYLSYFDHFPNQSSGDHVSAPLQPMWKNTRFFMRGLATVVERHLTYIKDH